MKKTIRDFDLMYKKVILRSDLNVPIENGIITDENRILKSLESINYLIEKKAKIILLSHLGRVKKEEDKAKNSLRVVYERLNVLLEGKVKFLPVTRGLEVEKAINEMNFGTVLMLENTRFEDLDFKKESSNNFELSKYWSNLGDIFINDAFGTCHREHASNVGISTKIPSGIGFLVEKELKTIKGMIENPKHEFVVIMGGSKVSDKIPVINNLIDKVDKLIICGGMAYTFYKALGYNIGLSIVDDSCLDYCLNLYKKYKEKIVLPIDDVVGGSFSNECSYRTISDRSFKNNEMGLDIGSLTIDKYKEILSKAKNVIWNGPCGVFEFSNFSKGTFELCKILKNIDADVIVGGGDSASFVINNGFKESFYHVSTGGGAMLELISGKTLPGVDNIDNL